MLLAVLNSRCFQKAPSTNQSPGSASPPVSAVSGRFSFGCFPPFRSKLVVDIHHTGALNKFKCGGCTVITSVLLIARLALNPKKSRFELHVGIPLARAILTLGLTPRMKPSILGVPNRDKNQKLHTRCLPEISCPAICALASFTACPVPEGPSTDEDGTSEKGSVLGDFQPCQARSELRKMV